MSEFEPSDPARVTCCTMGPRDKPEDDNVEVVNLYSAAAGFDRVLAALASAVFASASFQQMV